MVEIDKTKANWAEGMTYREARELDDGRYRSPWVVAAATVEDLRRVEEKVDRILEMLRKPTREENMADFIARGGTIS